MTSKYLTLFICTHKYWIEVIPFATVPVTLIKEMLHKNMGAFWLLTGCLFWV